VAWVFGRCCHPPAAVTRCRTVIAGAAKPMNSKWPPQASTKPTEAGAKSLKPTTSTNNELLAVTPVKAGDRALLQFGGFSGSQAQAQAQAQSACVVSVQSHAASVHCPLSQLLDATAHCPPPSPANTHSLAGCCRLWWWWLGRQRCAR
jgi:hypothetical protein